MSALKSIVTTSAPMWKPTLSQWKRSQMRPEQMCSPECCCMWSKRRAQSILPETLFPTSKGLSQRCVMTPFFSWTSSTFASPKTPVSYGWPPPSG